MSLLVIFVLMYLALTIGIGLYAARRVHNTKDYMIAGRSLPLYINMATVFATWFGAETVLSVSATFARDGLNGIPADPFGATACLIFVALFFAKAFYKMDLLTLGDFYRKRYNSKIEIVVSGVIVISYLGWTSAQLTALGLVLWVISGGGITLTQAIVIGTVIVMFYTIWGGMWSVAFTDMFQTVVIIVGLFIVAWFIGDLAGGASNVIAKAHADGKLDFWPKGGAAEWFAFVAAWATLAIGSIPQQDVFQRVTSAKDEKTAVRGTLIGGLVYFFVAFLPMFIAYAALMLEPNLVNLFKSEDAREIQRILPDIILQKTPLWIQVLFFGALLSAILSTASGALLAPTSLFANNILKPFVPNMGDARLLKTARITLVVFTCAALIFAVNSRSTMYEMVQNAYKVTMAGAFAPLVFGLFWKRATSAGAAMSIFAGLGSWIAMEVLIKGGLETIWPPQMVGLVVGLAAMYFGSLVTQPKHRVHESA
ncbi:MAG: sodium:solute symporter family protein [Nitrosomonadaceae bacterium]|jgi:SSS family solute:Na+ symporter|nr:sodium:solute symporter family protein [Nitrosomonadaceae bacterium]